MFAYWNTANNLGTFSGYSEKKQWRFSKKASIYQYSRTEYLILPLFSVILPSLQFKNIKSLNLPLAIF
jgi:hypothetical protein